jgi:hypothetical protein
MGQQRGNVRHGSQANLRTGETAGSCWAPTYADAPHRTRLRHLRNRRSEARILSGALQKRL